MCVSMTAEIGRSLGLAGCQPSSGFSEKSCQKGHDGENRAGPPTSFGFLVCAHEWTHTHTYTHTPTHTVDLDHFYS